MSNQPNKDPLKDYRADFDDDGVWWVYGPDDRRIRAGDRRNTTFILAEIYHDEDPAAAFDRIRDEMGS